MKKIGMLMGFSVLLTACSAQYTSNGEQRYLKSRNGPQIVVPSPLTVANISNFYDLPAQNQDARISDLVPSG